jgi:enoyl-CoA hydratase/carnithine racemase
MEYKTILADEDCGVATITLNRPDRLNAYVWRMGVELRHAICAFEVRDDIRAIVVTGAGRAFCAGADMAREQPHSVAAPTSSKGFVTSVVASPAS